MPITEPKSDFTSRREIREAKHEESQKTNVYIKGEKENGKKEK